MSYKIRKKYWQFLVSDSGIPISGAIIKVSKLSSPLYSTNISDYLPIYKTQGDPVYVDQTQSENCIKTDNSGFFSFWVQSEGASGVEMNPDTDVDFNDRARIEWYSGVSNGYIDDVYISTANVGPQGPQGVIGNPGPQGERSTITGPTGPQGAQSAIRVGEVTLSNSPSTQLSITNSGTLTDVVLNFTIPRGYQGVQGYQGRTGDTGFQGFQGAQGESSGMPIGSIIAFGGGLPPDGWLECNGQSIILSQYSALQIILGKTNVPDLRGEFIRGWVNGRTGISGESSSRDRLSFQDQDIQPHNHQFSGETWFANGWGPGAAYNIGWYGNGYSRPSTTNLYALNTTTSSGTETRPRNIACMYIIRWR